MDVAVIESWWHGRECFEGEKFRAAGDQQSCGFAGTEGSIGDDIFENVMLV